ncbi:hypothetical protein F2Q68_00010716 [Brassica cretica]|uniref:Uncharacterized protein n=1 Tax=Brassica cretica TaxID=69181 RepID=A0A8S9KPS6_BRACR|nr:hypothetical protein F2Q68_00010716 [Brassica cretica]
MVTPIEATQKTFRSRFEGERKDGGIVAFVLPLYSCLEVGLSRKGLVPGTGPEMLYSGDPGRLLGGTQRPVSCLGSGGIQYLSRSHTLNPGEDRFPDNRPRSGGWCETLSEIPDASKDTRVDSSFGGSFRVPRNDGQAGKPDEFVWSSVPGTELGVLFSGDLERSFIGTRGSGSCLEAGGNDTGIFFPNSLPLISRFCHRSRGITCALKSTGVAYSQQAPLRQDPVPLVLLAWVPLKPELILNPGKAGVLRSRCFESADERVPIGEDRGFLRLRFPKLGK